MRDATIRQCVILAGGRATRLGGLAADTPKPALDVGGRPFVYWLMREMLRFGVERFLFLTGHLSGALEQAARDAAAALPRPVQVAFSAEPAPVGTGGALFRARAELDERFLLANGDSLLACNLAHLLADAAADAEGAVGRLLLHGVPNASRYGVVALDGDRIIGFQERPAPGTPDVINAGVYALDRRVLDRLAPACSLERDLLPRLATEGMLRGTRADGWFIDIGIEEDLARARAELPARLRRPALFLDRDGVLNRDHGYVATRERWAWMDDALAALRLATDRGWHVFVVTNQSGVARGFYADEAVRDLLGWVAEEARRAGGTIDDWRYCPHHPESALPDYRRVCDCRKPKPGMLLDLMRAWDLDPSRCLLVGDQPSDLAAATAAGVPAHLFTGGNLASFLAQLLPAA